MAIRSLFGRLSQAAESCILHYVELLKRTREMSISHAEFLRLLDRALEGFEYRIDGASISARQGERRVFIRLSEEHERRLAMLSLPVTEVEIELEGFSESEAQLCLQRIDQTYRRGGG